MNLLSIFATDQQGGIGYQNSLPWPFNRKDMNNFLSLTAGKIVVMGSNTWFSLPNKLTNRINVVISTKSKEELVHNNVMPDYVISFKTVDEFENQVMIISERYEIPDICIIGGKQLYERLNPLVDVIIHTEIEGKYLCDTYIDVNKLTEDFEQTYLTKDDKFKLTVTTYRKKKYQ